MPDAFTLLHNGKTLEYRAANRELNEAAIEQFFEGKGYSLHSFGQHARHGICHLEKEGSHFFAKIARSEGISILTSQEIAWDTQASLTLPPDTIFVVPNIIEHGVFDNELVYFVAPWLDMHLIAELPSGNQPVHERTLSEDIVSTIVRMTLQIQSLAVHLPSPDDSLRTLSHDQAFVEKTSRWKEKIHPSKQSSTTVSALHSLVQENAQSLMQVTRHGDCAPWHMSLQADGRIYLFDGEHALSSGVYGYDIAYCVQRFFTVLNSPTLAQQLYVDGLAQGYDADQLRVVLAARAIGGYCDESLLPQQDFILHDAFAQWVLSL